jgi:integrase
MKLKLPREKFVFAADARAREGKEGAPIRQSNSAHSMRATFITRALDNGVSLEEVQRTAAHADVTITRLYDRRGYNPEKSASFFTSY